jgi:hypothetical protein
MRGKKKGKKNTEKKEGQSFKRLASTQKQVLKAGGRKGEEKEKNNIMAVSKRRELRKKTQFFF